MKTMSIIKNQMKTVVLLGLLTGLLLGAGQLLGGRSGLIIGFAIALLINFGSFWFSDKIVLYIYKAKELKEKDNPKLFKMVKEVAGKAGLPMPRVYWVEMPIANAFATGRSPKKAAVAVTRGIMELLEEDELKGVIAHELAHIKNRDTLISAVSATIAGVIGFLANMAQWAAIFGGFRGDDDNGNIIGMLALAIITPIIAAIIQLAISRSREYLADETGARFLHNGDGLAKALEKIEQSTHKIALRPTGTTEATAHLFIANPFAGKGMVTLFSTHPTTHERVRRLKAIKF